jgi:hypothetical protein
MQQPWSLWENESLHLTVMQEISLKNLITQKKLGGPLHQSSLLIEMVITESSVCRPSYFSIFQGDVLEFNEEKKVTRLG